MGRQTRFPLLVAFGVVAVFYFWTAFSDRVSWRFGRDQTDYYNLLVHGFLKGQLSLDAEVPAELLRAADPYDPALRPPGVALHDASLFDGKYYIYYGVVPAALVLLPFRVLTGTDLPLGAAVLGFALAGACFSLSLLTEFRRRFFPSVGNVALIAVGVTVGFASCVAFLIRRSSMYELPIVSGAAFAQAAWWCWFRAIFEPERRTKWTIATSLCWGLAIGSRPIYLLAPLSLVAGWWLLRPGESPAAEWRVRSRRWIATALVPLAVIGALLAAYNYARFGDPREFGLRYILSGVYEAKIEHFRLRYFSWNIHAYFFSTVEWGRYFPFLHETPIAAARPAQHYGMDIPFGLLVNVPFLWFAGLVTLGFGGKLGARSSREWRIFLGSLAWTALSVMGFLFGFYAAMARYFADFAPALALLAAGGVLGMLEWLSGWRRRVAGAVTAALALGSVGSVLLFSAKLYGRFRDYNPGGYRALERVANAPVRWWEAWRGEQHGPLLLRVSFPRDASGGRREELISTGWVENQDRVFVLYPGTDHIQLGFEHTGSPVALSAPLAVDRHAEHAVRISLGAFFPPESDAVFDGWSEDEKNAVLHRVQIELDGQSVVDRHQRFYDATPGTLRIGAGREGVAAFSGRVQEVSRASAPAIWRGAAQRLARRAASGAKPDAAGTIRLLVKFPEGHAGQREPLVTSGETGRGDFVVVEYFSRNQLRFVLDHWGRRPYFSPAIAYEPGREYRLELSHPYYGTARGGRHRAGEDPLRLSLDGQQVWECEPLFFPMEAADIFLGYNPIGGTSAAEKFTGEIAVQASGAP